MFRWPSSKSVVAKRDVPEKTSPAQTVLDRLDRSTDRELDQSDEPDGHRVRPGPFTLATLLNQM